jgi:hypothetical protein
MSIEKVKANKKILILLAFLVVASTLFFAFGEDIEDWRTHLDKYSISQSQSQMKVEIIRDGVVLDPSLSSTLTNKLDLSDIVDTPPTINAVVGDTIRITDISGNTVEPRAWDFQTYKNGSPFHTQQYFYGKDENPFPFEIVADEEAVYTFYLNVYNSASKVWSSYGDYRTLGTYKNEVTGESYPMWWYFTTLRVVVGEEEPEIPPEDPEINLSGIIGDKIVPYLDYVEDDTVDVPINFTANGYDDTGFNWEVNINSQKFNFTNESKNLNKTLKVNKENINLLSENSYSVNVSKDELSDSKNGNFNVSLENEPPEEFFQWFTMINGERTPYLYVGKQSVFTTHREGMSIDPEDDIFTEYYKMTTPSGDTALEFKKNYLTGVIDLDYMDLLINSVNLVERDNSTDLLIDFKVDGTYYTYLELEDMKTTNDLKEKVVEDTRHKIWWSFPVQVTPEPTPPIADFDMPRYSIPNHNVPVVDKSTDVNNDIVSRVWTHEGSSSGSLNGGGGGAIQYPSVGKYDVTLSVTDAVGLTDTITKQIEIVTIKAILGVDTNYNENGKVNRLVELDSSGSIAIPANPIIANKTVFDITPLDGQSPDSIKIGSTSTFTKKNVLFKESGNYEVSLRVENSTESSTMTEIITIVDDEPPFINFAITSDQPNFDANPIKTSVVLKDFSGSIDEDTLALFDYTIESIDTGAGGVPLFTTSQTAITPPEFNFEVPFRVGSSARYKAVIKIKEEFGQPTINEFVTSADRLETVEEREFLINWIPKITVNGLPDKFYADETKNVTTILKDEVIDTCDVVWSMRVKDQLNVSNWVPVDIDTILKTPLTKAGGIFSVVEGFSGMVELSAIITDEHGDSSIWVKEFRVYPLPTAMLEDNPDYRYKEFYDLEYGEAWKIKQNRKMGINGMSSYHTDYYTPDQPFHNINHGYDYWEIIPLDGQSVDSIMVKQNKTQNDNTATKLNPTTYSMEKFIVRNVPLDIELLFKEHGRYQINYQVTTLNNKKSIMTSKIITVIEDTVPRIDFFTPEVIYRNEDGETATISVSAVNFYSLDGDFTPKENMRLRYKFDSNNDGVFGEDFLPSNENNWVSVPFNEGGKRFDITVNKVGKYQIELLGKETFREPTIGAFISDDIGNDDRKENWYYSNVEVDNLAPLATLSVNDKTVKEIDIMVSSFNLGNDKTEFYSKIEALKTRLWNEKQVKANIIPYRDTQVNDSNPNDIQVDYSLLDDMLTMDYNDNQKFVISKGVDYSYPPYGNDRHTVFLLQSDHESVSSTFVDSSWVAKKRLEMELNGIDSHAITKVGNPIHTPEDSKIGKSSIKFNKGDKLITKRDNLFNLFDTWSTENATIDFWVKCMADSPSGRIPVLTLYHFEGTEKKSLQVCFMDNPSFPNKTFIQLVNFDGINTFIYGASTDYFNKNEWVHVAIQDDHFEGKQGIFINGVKMSDLHPFSRPNDGTILELGSGSFKGYIDEFRMSKGISRYSSNFTPETKHYRMIPEPTWELIPESSTKYNFAKNDYRILSDGRIFNLTSGVIYNQNTGASVQTNFRPPNISDTTLDPTYYRLNLNLSSYYLLTHDDKIVQNILYESISGGSRGMAGIYMFNASTGNWDRLGNAPNLDTWTPLYATFNNKIFAIGGNWFNSDRSYQQTAYRFDQPTWVIDSVVSNIANRPWYSHTDTNWRGIEEALIVSNNKKIYVVGGYPNNNISRAFSRVVLNGTTPVYTRMADLNYKDCVGRSHGRLDFLSGDRILMTLGAKYNNGWSGQFEHTATAFIYDEVLNMWSKIPNTPVTELVRDYKSYVRGFYDLEKNFVLPISDNRFLVLKEPKTDVPEPFKSVTELYSPTKRVQIMGEQLSNNTDILFINNTSNQAIINNTLALSGNKGAFIPESNINTEVEAVYQYIISKLDEEPENLTYFTFDPVNDINDVDVTFGVTIDDP